MQVGGVHNSARNNGVSVRTHRLKCDVLRTHKRKITRNKNNKKAISI